MGSTIRMTGGPEVGALPDEADLNGDIDPLLGEGGSIRPDDAGESSTGTRWIAPAAMVLLVAVFVVSTVVGVLSGLSARNAAVAEGRDKQVLEVASGMAVNLVTLGQHSADSDLSRVIDGTTGEFREQFVSAAEGFGALLTEGGVESTGEVRSSGIVDANEEAATVLAAVTSTVKNNEAPEGEIRVYRMKLSLTKVDGAWLVSNVEFVA